MISLFIDTHTNYLNIALVKNHEVVAKVERESKEHSTETLSAIDACLKTVGVDVNDVDDIYVVNGPGSFTGIRIGVTIAKTLAYTLNKKITAVSSLMAYVLSSTDADYYVSLIDARRGNVFASIVVCQQKIILEEQHLSLVELLAVVAKLNGTKTFISYNNFTEVNSSKPIYDYDKIISYYQGKSLNPHHINPNYLKKTEAEEKLQ